MTDNIDDADMGVCKRACPRCGADLNHPVARHIRMGECEG